MVRSSGNFRIHRILILPLVWLAAAIFLFEEFLWDWSAALMARLGVMRFVRAVEQWIASLSPRWALVAFLLPSLTIIPAKLIGLHALADGHWLLGSGIIGAAKLAGMALFSRIFNLTRPALMSFAWFASLYEKVMGYRNRIHAYLDNWAIYQRIRKQLLLVHFMFKGKGRAMRFLRLVRRMRVGRGV
jgi:hypothetical protein